MSAVITDLRATAKATRADHTALRAAAERTSANAPGPGARMETRLPFDLRAPAAARMVVDGALAQHVSASTLEDAKLAMSELVTNSLQHSGAAAHGTLLIGVGRLRGGFWLAVEDAGQDGFVGPRAPDRQAGGGFGLHLVEDLCECWGTVRAARRGTRVWAQFSTAATRGEP